MSNPHAPPGSSVRWLHLLSWLGSLAAFGLALWLLHRYVTHLAWRDVATAWSQLPGWRIAGSASAALLSLTMLAMFDVLAARTVVRERIAAKLAAFAGAVTQGISNTLGFHAITGTALRYRIYATAGLGASDIARIVALAGFGVGLGFTVVITGALCWQPAITQGWGRWPGAALSKDTLRASPRSTRSAPSPRTPKAAGRGGSPARSRRSPRTTTTTARLRTCAYSPMNWAGIEYTGRRAAPQRLTPRAPQLPLRISGTPAYDPAAPNSQGAADAR